MRHRFSICPIPFLNWPEMSPLFAVDIPGTGLAALGVLISLIAIYVAGRHARNLVRVQRQIEAAQEQTQTLRKETLDALQIHETLVSDERLGHGIRRLAHEFSKTLDLQDPLLIRLARRDLDSASERIRMGAEGHRVIGEDAFSDAEALASILLEMTEPGDEFWASSLVHADFWVRADAYIYQQQEKVSQKVDINRVFVFDTSEALADPHAKHQMARQVQANINVNHLVQPASESRDIVVVRKKDTNAPNGFREAYAAEFTVDPSKRIDNIDIWAGSSGVHFDRVEHLWWSLQGSFNRAVPFTGEDPDLPALASSNEHD
jgi:hypothetical protein